MGDNGGAVMIARRRRRVNADFAGFDRRNNRSKRNKWAAFEARTLRPGGKSDFYQAILATSELAVNSRQKETLVTGVAAGKKGMPVNPHG
jgi:hypothetical protein